MYFVVYLHKLNKHFVIPAKWIKGIEKQLEKFINVSLNKSQIFLCFHTTNAAAFIDGRPDAEFEPDFSTIVNEVNADGSYEGCFYGNLKRFQCKFLILLKSIKEYLFCTNGKFFEKNSIYDYVLVDFCEAEQFMAHLRNVKPPIYNHNRLKEIPIPSIDSHDDAEPSTSSQQTVQSRQPNSSLNQSDEDSFTEPSIFESDHIQDNNGDVSKDPLELPSNSSIRSIEFHGFDESMAIEGSEVSVTVGNVDGNGDSASQSDIETNSSQQHLDVVDENAETHSELVANELTIEVNTSQSQSAPTDQNSIENGERATNDFDNATENNDVSGTNDNLPNSNQVDIEANRTSESNECDATNDLVDEGPINIEAVESVESAEFESVSENQMNNPENSTAIREIKTEERSLYLSEIHSENSNDIDDVLDEPEVIVWGEDQDVVITVGRHGIPKPWATTTEKSLIKREEDPMSGEIPFNVNPVSEFLFYY